LGRSTVLQLTTMNMSALACSSTEGLSLPLNSWNSFPLLAAAHPTPPVTCKVHREAIQQGRSVGLDPVSCGGTGATELSRGGEGGEGEGSYR
jgi:hypothetical protein